MKFLKEYRMHTPGPGHIPLFIKLSSISQTLHHRDESFRTIYSQLQKNLQYVFQTNDPILVMTSSGTGAMESIVKNLISKEDSVLVIDSGKYSHRWIDLLNRNEIKKIHSLKSSIEGTLLPLVNIEIAINNIFPKYIFVSHCETSTGITYDIEKLANLCKSKNIKLIVDAMATIGIQPLYKDLWGIDVVISASHKGFMNPPGLAFISASHEILSQLTSCDTLYFDYTNALLSSSLDTTPNSPATSLILGVYTATEAMKSEGINNIWDRHRICASICRSAIKAMGLKLYSKNSSGNGVTVVSTPEGMSSEDIISKMKAKFGILISNGQDKLKNKIFRLGHMGSITLSDILLLIVALEITLCELKSEPYTAKGIISAWQKYEQLMRK